jgi:hypothetical protein
MMGITDIDDKILHRSQKVFDLIFKKKERAKFEFVFFFVSYRKTFII